MRSSRRVDGRKGQGELKFALALRSPENRVLDLAHGGDFEAVLNRFALVAANLDGGRMAPRKSAG